jgi:hypothetical protein
MEIILSEFSEPYFKMSFIVGGFVHNVPAVRVDLLQRMGLWDKLKKE